MGRHGDRLGGHRDAGGGSSCGGLGYLADRLLGIEPRILTAVGIVLGAGLAIYLVYLRFGKGEGNRGGA